MSIQSFTEKLLADIEKDFENEANELVKQTRTRTGRELYIVGRMDGISDIIKKIHEVYSLFVKSETDTGEDDAKPLY